MENTPPGPPAPGPDDRPEPVPPPLVRYVPPPLTAPKTDIRHTDVPLITPSSVNDLDCPKKYHMLRVLKQWPKRPFLGAVSFGTTVHEVLRQLFTTRDDEGILDFSNLGAIVRAVVKSKYPHDCDLKSACEAVTEAVCLYVAQESPEDIAATICLERKVEFDCYKSGIKVYRMGATIDRMLVRQHQPNHLTIKEYKTGAPRIDLKECFVIMWCGKKCFDPDPAKRQPQPPNPYKTFSLEFEFINIEAGTVTREIVHGKEVEGQYRLIHDAAQRVFGSTEKPACPGSVCTFCPFREPCQGFPGEELHDGEFVF